MVFSATLMVNDAMTLWFQWIFTVLTMNDNWVQHGYKLIGRARFISLERFISNIDTNIVIMIDHWTLVSLHLLTLALYSVITPVLTNTDRFDIEPTIYLLIQPY